jgi:adenine specific DNA methylase Mod
MSPPSGQPFNTLYYGDNLTVLRDHVPDASVDLVYLDPPFNSNADYNVLFAERDGTEAAAQIKAFEDTWRWDAAAAAAFHDAVQSGHGRVPDAMRGFHAMLGESEGEFRFRFTQAAPQVKRARGC